MVLKRGVYHVESNDPHVLLFLLDDPIIHESVIPNSEGEKIEHHVVNLENQLPCFPVEFEPKTSTNIIFSEHTEEVLGDPDGDILRTPTEHYFMRIDGAKVEEVRKRCIELDYPLLEEYDFRKDNKVLTIRIDLKPTTRLRAYQEKCLGKMFSNGRARSGMNFSSNSA